MWNNILWKKELYKKLKLITRVILKEKFTFFHIIRIRHYILEIFFFHKIFILDIIMNIYILHFKIQ